MTRAPCGPPKPRNAVLLWMFVRAAYPRIATFGSQYALSTWHIARVSTGPERSALCPAWETSVTSSPRMRPLSSYPTSYSNQNACRLPVTALSSARSMRILTGRPVTRAATAAMQANWAAWLSLPPNPPPMRRHSTCTRLLASPRLEATSFCTSVGCWVEQSTGHPAVVARHDERGVALEVEVLLAADVEGAVQPVRGRRDRRLRMRHR